MSLISLIGGQSLRGGLCKKIAVADSESMKNYENYLKRYGRVAEDRREVELISLRRWRDQARYQASPNGYANLLKIPDGAGSCFTGYMRYNIGKQ